MRTPSLQTELVDDGGLTCLLKKLPMWHLTICNARHFHRHAVGSGR